MKKIVGIQVKHLLVVFFATIVLVFMGVSVNRQILERWTPEQTIVGTWTGVGETRGFGDLEEIEVRLVISESGSVSGSVGDAQIEDCDIKLNRNAFERFLRVKTDYIINDGYLQGQISDRDELSDRDISMPFNITDNVMDGTLFHVEGWSYPDPLLLHLNIEKDS